MYYIKLILSILNEYADLGMFILAIISLGYIRKEYLQKRRPYVDIKIANTVDATNGNRLFGVVLVNKGTYPGIAKISKAVLNIGDETYITSVNATIVLAPNEEKHMIDIGHINKIGLDKLRTNQFKKNRIEIIVESESKCMGDKKFSFGTQVEYEVDFSINAPVLKVVSENIY